MANETLETGISFVSILPYIVSVLCATIAGFSSYAIARKQTKSDIKKLEKQYELDLEKERERFAMDKERLEIEHKHQLELIEAQTSSQLGTDLVSTMAKEYLRSPAGQSQIRNASGKRHR